MIKYKVRCFWCGDFYFINELLQLFDDPDILTCPDCAEYAKGK